MQGSPSQVFSDLGSIAPAFDRILYGDGIIRSTLLNIQRRQQLPGRAALACSYRSLSSVERIRQKGSTHNAYRKARCLLNTTLRSWVVLVMHSPEYLDADNYDNSFDTNRIEQHAHVRVHYASRDYSAHLLLHGCGSFECEGAPGMPRKQIGAGVWRPYEIVNLWGASGSRVGAQLLGA